MRRAARRDYNELEIVAALEAIGVSCFRVNEPGLPDLLTHARGIWLPIEVKRPRGQLTRAQQARQAVAPCPVVTSVAEALALFGIRA